MSNSSELKVKYHGNKDKPTRKKNPNVASVSKLGYRDDSPYRSLPYIDIDTPSGRIDMSNTGIPLWANGRILPPYSGIHQFDTTQVKEIPLAQTGRQVKVYTDPEEFRTANQAYQDSSYLYNTYTLPLIEAKPDSWVTQDDIDKLKDLLFGPSIGHSASIGSSQAGDARIAPGGWKDILKDLKSAYGSLGKKARKANPNILPRNWIAMDSDMLADFDKPRVQPVYRPGPMELMTPKGGMSEMQPAPNPYPTRTMLSESDEDIMMPSGQRISKKEFIKRYGQPAWDRATNQGRYKKQGGSLPLAQTGRQVTSADSLVLYNQSKAVQDYYRSQGYKLGENSYPVPDNYIDVARTKMNELGKRYNKFAPADDGDNDAERIVPYLLGPNGETYMKASGNFIERAASSNLHKWGKDKYKKAFLDMYGKLKNPPRGFTPLLDMYNSSFMDTGVPVQYLSPLIKPTKSMSASGTGSKEGNYDEIFTYDLSTIKPWSLLTDKEKEERLKRQNTSSPRPTPRPRPVPVTTRQPVIIKTDGSVVSKVEPKTKSESYAKRPDDIILTDYNDPRKDDPRYIAVGDGVIRFVKPDPMQFAPMREFTFPSAEMQPAASPYPVAGMNTGLPTHRFTAAGYPMVDTDRNSPTFGKTITVPEGYSDDAKEKKYRGKKQTGGWLGKYQTEGEKKSKYLYPERDSEILQRLKDTWEENREKKKIRRDYKSGKLNEDMDENITVDQYGNVVSDESGYRVPMFKDYTVKRITPPNYNFLGDQLPMPPNVMQAGGSLPKAQRGMPHRLVVYDPNDPNLKAFQDSSSLYRGGKKAWDFKIKEELQRDLKDWQEFMDSPDLTDEEKKRLEKPKLSDYLKYDDINNRNFAQAERYDASRDRIERDYRGSPSILKSLASDRSPYENYGYIDYSDPGSTLAHYVRNFDNPIKPHWAFYGEGLSDVIYKKPVREVVLAREKPIELMTPRGGVFGMTQPEMQLATRPQISAPETKWFTGAGQPMIDVRTGKTTEVPMGYQIMTDEKGIRHLSEKEKNYRLNKKQKGGWLKEFQGVKGSSQVNLTQAALKQANTSFQPTTTAVRKAVITPVPFENEPIPELVNIKDTRKIHPVTGLPMNPNRDYKSGNYEGIVIKKIIDEGKKLGFTKNQILDNIAIALQESGLGRSDDEIGHALYGDPITGMMNNVQVLPDLGDVQLSDIDAGIRNQYLNYKYNTQMINKNPKSDAELLQWYNTPYPKKGQLNTGTEKEYHTNTGRSTNRFYGVDVSKAPLKTTTLPYGKTIVSLRDSLIASNADIQKMLMQAGYKKTGGSKLPPHLPEAYRTGGWLKKYKKG